MQDIWEPSELPSQVFYRSKDENSLSLFCGITGLIREDLYRKSGIKLTDITQITFQKNVYHWLCAGLVLKWQPEKVLS